MTRHPLRELIDLCNRIEYKTNDYSRLDLSNIYDRAKIGFGILR